MHRPKIGIVLSTTREERFGEVPARWILDIASVREDLDFEIVDLRDYPLPLFGEAAGPAMASPRNEVALRWGEKMAELDGYLFVTAEYNHSVPGALKNALDHVYPECNNKPAAFVGYGGVGGARAVEQLRLICIELKMAPTRTAVHIGMEPYLAVKRDGKELSEFAYLNKSAAATLDELAWWTHTLKAGRAETAAGTDEQIDEILGFWFGEEGDPSYGESRKEWFSAEPEFDAEIRERFLTTYAKAREGKLDHFQQEPRGALALVLMLDQLPRNMFRHSPGMYETDEKARSVAGSALDKGHDQELPHFQRWFLYMPFLHSENVGDQRRAMELFENVQKHNSNGGGPGDWHLRTIERFGRFPHRNEILGRESTPKELEFLEAREHATQEA